MSGSSPGPLAVEKGGEKIFTIYPNPTSGSVSVAWLVPLSTRVAVKIVSAQGVVVNAFHSPATDLGVSLSAFLQDAPTGVYQIQIVDGARSYATRVVKN